MIMQVQCPTECLSDQCSFSLIHVCAVWGECLCLEGLSSFLCSDKNVFPWIRYYWLNGSQLSLYPRSTCYMRASVQDEKK